MSFPLEWTSSSAERYRGRKQPKYFITSKDEACLYPIQIQIKKYSKSLDINTVIAQYITAITNELETVLKQGIYSPRYLENQKKLRVLREKDNSAKLEMRKYDKDAYSIKYFFLNKSKDCIRIAYEQNQSLNKGVYILFEPINDLPKNPNEQLPQLSIINYRNLIGIVLSPEFLNFISIEEFKNYVGGWLPIYNIDGGLIYPAILSADELKKAFEKGPQDSE